MKYRAYWPTAAQHWDSMQTKPSRVQEFKEIAAKILRHKDRYVLIGQRTGVPWYLIAVLHERESNGDFSTYLGNGQHLDQVTTIVPKGRGPFASFEDGAVDALTLDGLINVKDWCLEKCLYYAESFNGWGYANRGLPSPYIWGGTSVQKPGKYVSDGRFNPKAWDTQPGCAPILAALADQDSTIQFTRET